MFGIDETTYVYENAGVSVQHLSAEKADKQRVHGSSKYTQRTYLGF